jgi:hypothetical protein
MKTHYTYFDTLMASQDAPLSQEARNHQLGKMQAAMHSIRQAPSPTTDDWRLLSDCVNMLETLVTRGPWLDTKKKPDGTRDLITVVDSSGLLEDAVRALAEAGRRHMKEGKPIRLDGEGIKALTGALEDYEACVNTLSERTMVLAHRTTEKRLQEIMSGKRKPHDVEVMVL